MARNLLNDKTILSAKPTHKNQRLNDGEGLYLLIKPTGAKWWRFDYPIEGKRKTLSLGVYPKTGLADARRKAEDARTQKANGIDPSETRKQIKAARETAAENIKRLDAGLPILNSFEHIARDYLSSIAHGVRDVTNTKKLRRFELHTFPVIGVIAIDAIKSPDVYGVLKPIIARNGLETAHRVHAEISAAFNYAIAHGLTDYNPAQAVSKQIPPQKVKHRAAITEPKDIGQLLRDIYSYNGTFVVQCAFRFSPLVFQRPGEIRQMEWKDVDLIACEWRYFVTKTEVNHIVPLSKQAIAVLEQIKPLTDVMCFLQAVAMVDRCQITPSGQHSER